MSTILATNNNFLVHGPAILKLGEQGIFFLMDRPEYDSADSISWICEIRLPDGSRATPEMLDIGFTMSGGLALSGKKVVYVPSQVGTHLIAMQFYNATTLTQQSALMAFHVPAWLNNIDRPISDIAKSNTEISRLRTVHNRRGGGIL